MTLISCVKCDSSSSRVAGLAKEGWLDPNQVDSLDLAAVNHTSDSWVDTGCRPGLSVKPVLTTTHEETLMQVKFEIFPY